MESKYPELASAEFRTKRNTQQPPGRNVSFNDNVSVQHPPGPATRAEKDFAQANPSLRAGLHVHNLQLEFSIGVNDQTGIKEGIL